MGQQSKKSDMAGGLIFICLGIFVMVQSIKLQVGNPTEPQPGFFPFLGSFFLLVTSVILFFQGLRGRSTGSQSFGNYSAPAVTFAGSICYVAILSVAGFVIATALLSVLVIRVLGGKRWWENVAVGFTLSLGSYFLFAKLLDVPLPLGVLSKLF